MAFCARSRRSAIDTLGLSWNACLLLSQVVRANEIQTFGPLRGACCPDPRPVRMCRFALEFAGPLKLGG